MKFFTDKTVLNDYLLIKITDYIRMKNKTPEKFERWKEILIDPCVYELKKNKEYSWVKEFTYNSMRIWIRNLPQNHYFSWDYPCDMNEKYTNYFLTKTFNNAKLYSSYKGYIVCVQSKFKDFLSFTEWFHKYNNLEIKSGILALGNLCRIHYLTEYIKHSLKYAFYYCKHPRIHIYGLGLRIIPYAYKLAEKYNIDLSIDSTKWTRACNSKLKWSEGYNCKGKNRQLFFDEYLKTIRERGVELENE